MKIKLLFLFFITSSYLIADIYIINKLAKNETFFLYGQKTLEIIESENSIYKNDLIKNPFLWKYVDPIGFLIKAKNCFLIHIPDSEIYTENHGNYMLKLDAIFISINDNDKIDAFSSLGKLDIKRHRDRIIQGDLYFIIFSENNSYKIEIKEISESEYLEEKYDITLISQSVYNTNCNLYYQAKYSQDLQDFKSNEFDRHFKSIYNDSDSETEGSHTASHRQNSPDMQEPGNDDYDELPGNLSLGANYGNKD